MTPLRVRQGFIHEANAQRCWGRTKRPRRKPCQEMAQRSQPPSERNSRRVAARRSNPSQQFLGMVWVRNEEHRMDDAQFIVRVLLRITYHSKRAAVDWNVSRVYYDLVFDFRVFGSCRIVIPVKFKTCWRHCGPLWLEVHQRHTPLKIGYFSCAFQVMGVA